MIYSAGCPAGIFHSFRCQLAFTFMYMKYGTSQFSSLPNLVSDPSGVILPIRDIVYCPAGPNILTATIYILA